MKSPRHRFLRLTAGAAALSTISAIFVVLCGHGAWSQTTKTIKIVVPAPPGGGTDILARLLADQISRSQGPTMVIENRPGAGGVIAAEAVARTSPDGSTLLIESTEFIVTPHLRKLNYDPLTSFEPICDLVRTPMVIVVNSASPYHTLADLLSVARAKPGDLTLAGIGSGSSFQIATEVLKRAANVNMIYVPYPGGAPAVNALLGGHVTSAWVNYPPTAEMVNVGKLRALATPARTRIEALPDVPTVAESGYKEFEADTWFGLFAPAKTPNATVSKLAGWFTTAMQVPKVKASLVIQGLYPVGMCGADFGALIGKQYDEYGRIIREANIKVE